MLPALPSRLGRLFAGGWWRGLAAKLLVLVLLAATLPPLILGILMFRTGAVLQTREALDRSREVAGWGLEKVESYVENLISDLELNLALLLPRGDLRAAPPRSLEPGFALLLKYMENVRALALLDPDGRERLKLSEEVLFTTADLRDRGEDPLVRQAQAGERVVGRVYTSAFSEPMVRVVLPIQDVVEGRLGGLLVAEVNLKRLWDEVLAVKVGRSGYIYVLDENLRIIAHPDYSLVLMDTSPPFLQQVREVLLSPEGKRQGEYLNHQGERVLGVAAQSRRLGWHIVVERPAAEAYAYLNEAKVQTVFLLLNTLLITILLGSFAAQRLSRPIGRVIEGARRVGAGDLDHMLPVEGPAEIGELARTFNTMTSNLRESFVGLQALLTVSRRLATSLKLHEVLEAGLQGGLENLQATHCAVLLCPQAEGSESSPPRLFAAGPDGLRRAEEVSLEVFPAFARALETQEAIVGTADGGADPAWTVLVPLTAGGVPLGAMAFALPERPDGVTASRLSLFRAVANQVAVAVQNAELYERLRGYSENLEQRVEERTRDLRALNQQLQEANRHKSQFLANMSHELRTPLNSIIGFSEVLLDGAAGELTDRQRLYLDTILDSGQHLLTLISDILDVAKIEAGKVQLEPTLCPCADLVEEAVDVVRPQAERKRLRLGGRVDPLSTTVWADRSKLRQVLLNLLSNAVKFTPEGGEVQVTAGPGPGGAVEFRVVDTGIGIQPKDQERIFQPFEQVDNSYSRRYEGTGLGLSLTRRLVELHGGSIRVQSDLGAGSTFIVTLPPAALPA